MADTVKLTVDLATITFRDMADMEAAGGNPAALGTGTVDYRTAAALLWVVRRKEQPGFTFDDALDLPLGAVELEVVDGAADPKGNGVSAGSPPSVSAPGSPPARSTT